MSGLVFGSPEANAILEKDKSLGYRDNPDEESLEPGDMGEPELPKVRYQVVVRRPTYYHVMAIDWRDAIDQVRSGDVDVTEEGSLDWDDAEAYPAPEKRKV